MTPLDEPGLATLSRLPRTALRLPHDVAALSTHLRLDEHGALVPLDGAPTPIQVIGGRIQLPDHLRQRFRVDPALLERLRRHLVAQTIERAWLQQGGRRSQMGPPVHPDLSASRLRETGGALAMDFAGGTVEVRNGQGSATFLLDRVMQVRWVGMECEIRQEDLDELYGVVSCLGGFNEVPPVHTFGSPRPVELAPKSGGRRIHTADVLLYQGPPVPVTLGVAQVEADSGDVAATAHRIATIIQQQAAAAASAYSGAPADAVAENDTLHDVLVLAVDGLLGGIFGIGDDPYGGAVLAVTAEEVARGTRPAQQPPATRPGSLTIPRWTHRVTCQGIDDGGDLGQYRHYFQIDITDR